MALGKNIDAFIHLFDALANKLMCCLSLTWVNVNVLTICPYKAINGTPLKF